MLIVDNTNFKKEVLENKLVVVDFYSDFCPPCKLYAPVFEKTQEKFKEEIKFVKLNTDNAIDIAREYGVMSIPTTIFFKNGKPSGKISGALAEEDLIAWIKNHL